jgi:hypothetical protein
MTAMAVAPQVHAISGSTCRVGPVGLFSLVPLIGFGSTAGRSPP